MIKILNIKSLNARKISRREKMCITVGERSVTCGINTSPPAPLQLERGVSPSLLGRVGVGLLFLP
jgi:hypothetical protein